jgi:hypothetical protein
VAPSAEVAWVATAVSTELDHMTVGEVDSTVEVAAAAVAHAGAMVPAQGPAAPARLSKDAVSRATKTWTMLQVAAEASSITSSTC